MEKIFKYKLDFYYQIALLYLITLIAYVILRGSIIEENFFLVFKDPILYIIIFFVLSSFIVLCLNLVRNRRLIIADDSIIFKHNFNERKIKISDIEWMYIGKEWSVRTAGRSQVIMIKTKDRGRLFRIRIGRYEHRRELLHLISDIAKNVPQKKHWKEILRKRYK